jgi:flagellar motility protein MotE (MotC chaperone)
MLVECFSILKITNGMQDCDDKLRYIVFMIDSKTKDHDGKVFTVYKDAKEYAADIIESNYADKAVIGMFKLNEQCREMIISMVETIGFRGDKNKLRQLDLFKPSTG